MENHIKTALEELQKSREIIGAERDKLRDIMDEFESQLENCNTAIEDLDSCIQTLSELV